MPNLHRDLRYACRGLLRTPLFTLVAVVSIALGIGANTAIFTLIDQVLLRQLPVTDPQQLVLLTQRGPHQGNNRGGNSTSFPMYEDFREGFVDHSSAPALPRVSLPYDALPSSSPLFSGMFARYAMSFNVGYLGRTDRVTGELVSGTYFPVLGVRAEVGRVITPQDDRVRAGHPVAVLSYEYWRNRFTADPNVIGKTIVVNNYPFTIIGVSQRGFDGVDIGYAPSVRVPMMMKAQMTPQWDDLDNRRSRWANVFGRLKPGVTLEQAKTTLQPYFHALRSMEVQEPPFRTTSAEQRRQFLTGTIDLLPAAQGRAPLRTQLRQPLWLLMGTVAGVLLIACANVASLLIARAAARQKEFAIRLALGAGRGAIVGQLLVESVMLATLGGLLGLGIARLTSAFLLGFIPTDETPHVISPSLDWRVLAFNFALAFTTGILFGLAPALRSIRPVVATTLKDQVGTVLGGGSGVRFRKALVVGQVTLSVLLLIGAGLFIRSLRNLNLTDLGMRIDNLIAFSVDPSIGGYSTARTQQFYQQLSDRMKVQAGVSGVAFASMAVLEGSEWDSTITVEGYQPRPGENMNPFCNAVSPDYFGTMGVAFVAGRDFDARDAVPRRPGVLSDTVAAGSPFRVAIVNESFARHYYGNASPVGRHIGFGGDPGTPTPIEIVGVVKDSKYTGVRDEIPRQVFFPYQQIDNAGSATVYVRATHDPSAAFAAARRTVAEIDSNIPIYNLRTLTRQVERSLLTERIVATLSTAFGALATLLAVIGLYGVMAYTAARRTREIGLRMAMGALSSDVIWIVMREVIVLVGTGVTLGLIAAWGLSRLIGNQMYGISPNDPVTMAAAASGLTIVALIAGYIPAFRAARINPVIALRCD
jgi:predicted permease